MQSWFGSCFALKPRGRAVDLTSACPKMCGKWTYLVFLLMKLDAHPMCSFITMKIFVKNSAHLTFKYLSCCCEKLNCFGGVKLDRK